MYQVTLRFHLFCTYIYWIKNGNCYFGFTFGSNQKRLNDIVFWHCDYWNEAWPQYAHGCISLPGLFCCLWLNHQIIVFSIKNWTCNICYSLLLPWFKKWFEWLKNAKDSLNGANTEFKHRFRLHSICLFIYISKQIIH